MTDPLARALKALQSLHAPRTDPVSVAFWEEVRDALQAAQRERANFMDVVRTGRVLLDALDRYEAAAVGDMKQVMALAADIETAEDAFVAALNRFPANLGAEGQLWSENTVRRALDHLTDDDPDEEEGDEKPRH